MKIAGANPFKNWIPDQVRNDNPRGFKVSLVYFNPTLFEFSLF
jgi:hypothetical protein